MVTARELRDMVYSCLIEDLRRINIAPSDEKHENSSFCVELENDSIEEDSIEEDSIEEDSIEEDSIRRTVWQRTRLSNKQVKSSRLAGSSGAS
jgi:hypothetical protein